MRLKETFFMAILLFMAALAGWELYWRNQGFVPDLNDEKNLWSLQRAKVENLDKEDVILTGSSRVWFDLQIYEWDKLTGRLPLQLAIPGSSPLPVFHDLVENSDFAGTVVVGVTPGLFFSTTFEQANPWSRPATRVKHYHNRTYAQQLNFLLSIPFQQNLALVSVTEEGFDDDTDLKALLKRIHIGNRTGGPVMPPFYEFSEADINRNNRMLESFATDTNKAKTVIEVWKFFARNGHPPEKEATMDYFLEDAKKFTARGGNLLLLRCPSSGGLRAGEAEHFPREEFWNELVKQSGAKSYHYEDYAQLNQFFCPEWSHLAAKDADVFTRELVNILLAGSVIQKTEKP